MIDMRLTFAGFGILFTAAFLLGLPSAHGQAGAPPSDRSGSRYQEWLNKAKEREKELREYAKEGRKVPYTGTHVNWDEDLHIVSRRENFRLKIGGRVLADGGNIDADDELQEAFPDLDGYEADFRSLTISATGTVRALSAVKDRTETTEDQRRPVRDTIAAYAPYDAVQFKLDIDFAQVRDIKDIWIRFPSMPLLGNFTFGHWKEPFSLEELTSITNRTFMESALPTDAFAPGRNMGIRSDNTASNGRITWAVGGFLNTSSFSDVGEATDRISEANGFDITARVTGLPWYEEEGVRLLHLGLSYTHGARNDKDIEEDAVRFRARPESRLTDERLVDTGDFLSDRLNKINPEFAIVSGPLSFQGEYFHTFTDADDEGDPDFWGLYVFGSYFLTGEHRQYNTSRGVFSRIRPERNFDPPEGGWGAFELGLRYSFIDLNDGAIEGGKESNLTGGVNCISAPTPGLCSTISEPVLRTVLPPRLTMGTQTSFRLAFNWHSEKGWGSHLKY